MKSRNTGRIDYIIQPGDYFLNNDSTWIRKVDRIEKYVIVTSYGLGYYDVQDNLEFNINTLLANTRLTKKQAHKMLKLAGYET